MARLVLLHPVLETQLLLAALLARLVLLQPVLVTQLPLVALLAVLAAPRARKWKVSSRVLVYTIMLIISLTVLRWDNLKKGSSCVSMPAGWCGLPGVAHE